jgi:hypothetical protein
MFIITRPGSTPPPKSLYGKRKRHPGDFYPTIDPDLILLLKLIVRQVLPPGAIWECAAGQGHLVAPIRAAGREVIASDITPGHPEIVRHDFLHRQLPPGVQDTIAVTNPPNSLLTEFLVRWFELMDAGRIKGFLVLTKEGAEVRDGRADIFNRAFFEWRATWRPWWEPRHQGEKHGFFTAQWTLWLPGHSGLPRTQKITRDMARSTTLEWKGDRLGFVETFTGFTAAQGQHIELAR